MVDPVQAQGQRHRKRQVVDCRILRFAGPPIRARVGPADQAVKGELHVFSDGQGMSRHYAASRSLGLWAPLSWKPASPFCGKTPCGEIPHFRAGDWDLVVTACPNWKPETRRCNCKLCRAKRSEAYHTNPSRIYTDQRQAQSP